MLPYGTLGRRGRASHVSVRCGKCLGLAPRVAGVTFCRMHTVILRSLRQVPALVATMVLSVRVVCGQSASSSAAVSGSVSGVVFDSLERRVLTGAQVQLVGGEANPGFSRTAVSDSAGRFMLADVPSGRYMLGFFHVMLDSIGLEPPVQEVVMQRPAALRVDLSMPSPSRLRAAICGAGAGSRSSLDSTAFIVGFVRDARDRAATPGAAVSAQWLEMSVGDAGVQRRFPRLVATTGDNGWYAICNVPRDGMIAMLASRNADSTDRLEVQVPVSGFLRRDLYLGRPVVRDTVSAAATTAAMSVPTRQQTRSGDGRISGRIVSADSERVVAGAIVAIRNGPETRADMRGEWELTGVPLGTRMLEVRAIGHHPFRRPVDVIPGVAPVRIALSSTKSVLDTVRVRAQFALDRRMSGFAERRRSLGAGRFLNADEIARRQPVLLADVFRTIPGLDLAGDAILMRGVMLDKCAPDFFVNGAYVGAMDAVDLDAIAKPTDVTGIEVYPVGTVPPQFDRSMGGQNCGSILIWTK